MPKEIAVYMGDNGETTSLYQNGKVMVYQRNQGCWRVSRERDFSLGDNFNIKALREIMDELIEFLGHCKTFVGLSITGIPYFVLEKSGCSIWEFEGNPLDFLDYILAKEEEEQRENSQQNSTILPTPVETFSGCYRISIKEIQEKNLGVSSKQVLLPFIRQGKFYSLEVLCNHVPPWLENEILLNQLESRTEVIARNEVKLVMTKKCCDS
ncbi:Nitrogenase iron-iron accessory protein AnfO [Desulfotomaculum nigrificans CO-1-SRB]|uniref:Nitrogenase iron-iron accessory protein AnfO n=1 Tax=Desulfotomaculum nigrificans (strain DSM 14880 / VKM B-2319 / CO-1-SRB) TaxID=868595 RepID=F6B3I0_DESCC|nr:Fe-only nitrogenase accessory AnfO family protein [Desulfotomaculum nigrificans]AEF94009.1 Nitrogenase iron-iron accessory protein AnfO [Desulfotomaculum nigrificans CO-1-SRB]